MPEGAMKIEQVMQTELHVISGVASVREALRQMREKHVTALIIERRDADDEYGLVTVEQIAAQVIALNRSPDRVSVYEIMDKPALRLNPHMAVRYAIRLLARLDQRRALVVGESGARGLVTLRDLVLCFAGEDGAG